MELCLETTYSRTEVTADRSKWKSPKKPKPLIAPTVKAADIKGWRTKWRNPKAPATDKRRLKIAEIKVHGSLYDFKAGNHIGVITLDQIHQISEALKNVVASFPDLIIRLDLEDEKLIQGYEKRQAAALKKAENKAEKLKKPATTKRGRRSKT